MISKKGDITDSFTFVILLIIFGVGLFIFAFVIPQIAGGLRSAGLNNSAEGAAAIDQMSDLGNQTMQNGFIFLVFGFIAAELISSFFIRAHPIFLVIYILSVGVSLLLGVYLHYMYIQIITQPIFADTLASQGFITLILDNINRVTLGTFALSLIIIFAKYSSFGGGGDQLG